jgi:glycosyltransferase A (GT-A) superfamily protein (DUF2064 family)
MSGPDPVGELVLLARAAAEAGEDWRGRLQREWLPRTLTTASRAALVDALAEWFDDVATADAELAAQLESVVMFAMADEGYN